MQLYVCISCQFNIYCSEPYVFWSGRGILCKSFVLERNRNCALVSNCIFVINLHSPVLLSELCIGWCLVDTEHVKVTSQGQSPTGEVHSGICHGWQVPVPFRSLYSPHRPFQVPPAPQATFPLSSTVPVDSLL